MSDLYRLALELSAGIATQRPELLPRVAQLVSELAPCRHGDDFASVSWHGQHFTFSATQAAIVRQLWRAWENGTPDVRQETLLHGSESESARLADIFKGDPAWNTLIVTGRRQGTFRLAIPEK